MDGSVSTSVSTIRHMPLIESQPSSPRSSALPSPPDSPSDDSVSSFPSVSSSFFFSSAAASPPHPHSIPLSDKDSQGLIIPSLTLPSALRRPTPYGQTLGNIRLLVLASNGTGRSFSSGILLEDNEDILEVGPWEELPSGCSVLKASTYWIEHQDAHGLEKFEPARNVEVYELPECEPADDPQALLQTVSSIIQSPFHTISDILAPNHPPSSQVITNLLASANTPLYTALILLLPDSQLPNHRQIVSTLSPLVPTILLPLPTLNPCTHPSTPSHAHLSRLSTVQPKSPLALRTALFHSPTTLAVLRTEAAERFCGWREVENTARNLSLGYEDERKRLPLSWDKAKWESEWEANLSKDVAMRLQTSLPPPPPPLPSSISPCPSFDPLHLPSLLLFSLSFLGPLRGRLVELLESGGWYLSVGFCLGVGVGFWYRS